MPILTIERLGGLAGFGGPRLKSEGKIAVEDLPPADRAAVERLFAGGSRPPTKGTGDVPNYRITCQIGGKQQSVEIPENAVPSSLVSSVRNTLL